MSKSPWGKIGNWAAEAERAEAEEQEAAEKAAAAEAAAATLPTLKQSPSTVKQKKKNTKMTLSEFTIQQSTYSGSAPSRSLTHEEMLRLPTGPRPEDEMPYGRLGGGVSNRSGAGTGGSNSVRLRDYDGRRSHGYEDDNRRGNYPQSRVSEFDQPSRADEVDDWISMKKQTLSNEYTSRPVGIYNSIGPGISSRADQVDNWTSMKKSIEQTRPPGFSRPEPDRWTPNEQSVEMPVKVNRPNPFGAARPREEVLAEKGLDWKKLDLEMEVKKKQNSVTGGSRSTSSQSSRPESQNSSRSEVGIGERIVKQKTKVNPFGDANPREVLLEEKGLDWRKIDSDLEHRRVERPETEEEKNLKEEIERLKKELLQKSGEDQTSMQDLILKRENDLELLVRQLDDKVRYSQKNLQRQSSGAARSAGFNDRPPSRPVSQDDQPPLASGPYEHARYPESPLPQSGGYDDSRAGFSGRPTSRPGAYEAPRSSFPERPPLRLGAYEETISLYPQRSTTHGANQEPRAGDYNVRPHWRRLSDDRSSFEGSRGRASLGSRDMDRSGSRW